MYCWAYESNTDKIFDYKFGYRRLIDQKGDCESKAYVTICKDKTACYTKMLCKKLKHDRV